MIFLSSLVQETLHISPLMGMHVCVFLRAPPEQPSSHTQKHEIKSLGVIFRAWSENIQAALPQQCEAVFNGNEWMQLQMYGF